MTKYIIVRRNRNKKTITAESTVDLAKKLFRTNINFGEIQNIFTEEEYKSIRARTDTIGTMLLELHHAIGPMKFTNKI